MKITEKEAQKVEAKNGSTSLNKYASVTKYRSLTANYMKVAKYNCLGIASPVFT